MDLRQVDPSHDESKSFAVYGYRLRAPPTRPPPRRPTEKCKVAPQSCATSVALWLASLALLNLAPTIALAFALNTMGGESMIKVTRFQVPAQVRPGELRRLTCLYELHGATLHAMKMFKDDKEFYRYTPNPALAQDERKITFSVVGVHVELARSNDKEVWLRTSKRSAGQYKCQVSIENTFNSVSAERRMEVVDGNSGAPPTSGQSNQHLAGASAWQQQLASGQEGRQLPIAHNSRAVQQQQQHNSMAARSSAAATFRVDFLVVASLTTMTTIATLLEMII